MPSASLMQLCDLVSDVAISNATGLCQRFRGLVAPQSVDVESEHTVCTFSFMNWTFAQGVWSNLHNTQLRRDLQIELKEAMIMKLTRQFCNSDIAEHVATKYVLLMEDFKSYVMEYTRRIQELGYADAGTARLFALERIQQKYQIEEEVMNAIVPAFWSDEKSSSGVESVASQVNKVAAEMKPKGLLQRLFGN